MLNYDLLGKAYASIRGTWPDAKPSTALICGSGWSAVIEAFEVHGEINYGDIQGLGIPGVKGHAGKLCWGTLHGIETFVWQGRRHFYEGDGWTPVALPVYVSLKYGIETMVLTNSAGCVRDDLKPGDLMVIEDHINNMGSNPLIGAANELWGTRFPDQSYVYTPALRAALVRAGEAVGLSLSQGVYFASTGPTYESPAEIRAYRGLGADAVGMSTLPEAILASAGGMQVTGLSCMTNYAAGISTQPLSHEEVTETAQATMPKMKRLLEAFWAEIGAK